jgi:YHS domain-containing protein
MKTHHGDGSTQTPDYTLTFDLVCGMEIVQREAKYSFVHHGVAYYFCTSTCLQHFKNTPERYLGAATEA